MDVNKYVVEDDSQVLNAGYRGETRYERERQKILDELNQYSPKTTFSQILIWLLGGTWGLHYFTNGKAAMGVLYLFTFGLFGIGWIIDLFRIASGQFTDANGKKIGSSSPGMFASQVHYDAKGRKTGSTYGSCSSLFGADHYDSRGRKVGDSHSAWFGSTHSEFDD